MERRVTWLYPSLAGIPNFLLYLAVGLTLSFVFAVVYVRITGHQEIRLIREGNASAAVAFGGALIGFALPLSKAISQASTIPDCVVWGSLALLVQLAAYGAARLVMPNLSDSIARDRTAAAALAASIAITAGLLNAAAMTYAPAVGGVSEAL